MRVGLALFVFFCGLACGSFALHFHCQQQEKAVKTKRHCSG